ncbi:Dehydrogenase family protein [Elusimicrobium minutum Pei191]|uniref:Dehydrogenase family protein n=1 Tax=Elusimicrobium minutum (strain Pei191) TaxID=445932 RepID=B2KBT9_ELUMP|nr:FAD-binding protein [Elusimicrobium minutum]ACC97843.1 Dehydrogenase family protein [Elusimicrobium minutum Pei191]
MKHFDIAIIGLGPAGATLARLLDGKFFRVAAIDKKGADSSFQKPCGGLLAPDAQKELAKFNLTLPKDILVDPQIFSVKTIDLKNRITKHYQRMYLNIDRSKFDSWLISLIPKNVKIFKNSICQYMLKTQRGFKIVFDENGHKQEITADYVVGADGADSFVRRMFFPKFNIRKYTAVQQWFKDEHQKPFYSCILDPENTDCYSWALSKDGHFIFGGAYPVSNSREKFERQKEKLSELGFKFPEPVKTEACMILRPNSFTEFCLGGGNVFLIGEAAGFISPSSLEGISSAFKTAKILGDIFNKHKENKHRAYASASRGLRFKLAAKLIFKCPFIYDSAFRKAVMNSGIKTIRTEE